MLRHLVIVSLFLFVAPLKAEERSCADELAAYPSSARSKQCAAEIRQPAESRLNLSYKNALSSMGSNGDARLAKSRLEQEQQAWKKYRDTHCKLDALYARPADPVALEMVCLAEMDDCRTEYLNGIFLLKIEGKDDAEAPINCVGR